MFPDTILWAAGFFLLSFLVVGLSNARTIRRMQIVDMLAAGRQNEAPLHKSRIRRLALKQLGFWFELPVGSAVVVSTASAACFVAALQNEISAYIGYGVLAVQLRITTAVLAALLGCYFVSTWALFRRSLKG